MARLESVEQRVSVRQSNCPFCTLESIEPQIIHETARFILAADLNPLVEGHLLVISRAHLPCYGALADMLWPGQSPLGRVLHLGQRDDPVEIVGVAPNALYDGPVHDPHPRYVFTPQHQIDDARLIDMTFFIRFEGTLEAIAPRIGRAINEAERSLPIVSMTTMQSRLDGVTVLERQVTTLLIAFAVASLVVAALGQYAVAAFNMRRRIRDFGVRMALGASARHIQRRVLSESLRLTLVGLAVGFLLSVAAGIGFTLDHDFQRWMKRTMVLEQLFGSRPTLQAEMGAELLARREAPRLLEL